MFDFTFLMSITFFLGIGLFQLIWSYMMIKPLREASTSEVSHQKIQNTRKMSTLLLTSGLLMVVWAALKMLGETELVPPFVLLFGVFLFTLSVFIASWWYFWGFHHFCSQPQTPSD